MNLPAVALDAFISRGKYRRLSRKMPNRRGHNAMSVNSERAFSAWEETVANWLPTTRSRTRGRRAVATRCHRR
jgi:hypothetical protein